MITGLMTWNEMLTMFSTGSGARVCFELVNGSIVLIIIIFIISS